MSFRLFIYYCAVFGGWAAFAGWALGRGLTGRNADFGGDIVQGLFLGITIALAMGVTDAAWNLTGRRYGQVVARGLLGALLGGLSGVIGAAAGHGLYLAGGKNDMLKIPGWVVVGLLVGASIGFYDYLDRLRSKTSAGAAMRKIVNGAIGGALGGVVGSVLFVLLKSGISMLFPAKAEENVLSSSAAGLVALGACIGLFIGLAQVILKEAWIKVESGRRAGREMILSKEETTIGRAEACDIGLFGDNTIERMHARILLRNSQYFVADADTPSGTYLNERRIAQPTPLQSGDAIRVGGSVLRFGERQKRK
jgi:hypothetical protein